LPESFNVLVRELQSLCLDVELVQKDGAREDTIAEPLITSGI
jgi:DNA-directed RNA polymerase subunit beta